MKLANCLAILSPLVAASAVKITGSNAPRDAKVNYDGYHVYRVSTANAPSDLQSRLVSFPSIDLKDFIEVAVPPNDIGGFEALRLDAQLLSNDLGNQIREESRVISSTPLTKRGGLPSLSWFDSYHSYDDHVQYWKDLHAAFPNNSQWLDIGSSYEGRNIFGLKLWGGKPAENKPIVLWHGTVHAREWITTMTVEYLTYQLIEGYRSGNKNVTAFFDAYDFYIVPFHNPDGKNSPSRPTRAPQSTNFHQGFVYTQTTDRLWRKNRQPRSNVTCIGTDGNRNWDFQWNYPLEDGSVSSDPCSQTFRGLSPGDTTENVVLSALSRKLAATPGGIRLFIDWHSYSQLILLPWGFSCAPDVLPKNLQAQRDVGGGYAAAINATSGEEYQVGPSCEILYYSTGSARDFHHGALNATYSWSVELRPKTSGAGGFVLPPELIRPTVKEHWEGIKYVLRAVG
ncbi:putative metallocarboxypeptidase A [Colletotrichum gloeosporioides]|uniref:Putative metallocarboxypeptidase A n=1 Tax=Colletotrichum gloeosporioides TaxID=474922 RepID=A0A8H4CAR0_COLGL|nr:putative metallocarboxypeptidase A [Colletotrichum gloeosporioides]KAF3800281.1 putative metallocarboxypeptidase A [Colletotrichum gloeosporioides]